MRPHRALAALAAAAPLAAGCSRADTSSGSRFNPETGQVLQADGGVMLT